MNLLENSAGRAQSVCAHRALLRIETWESESRFRVKPDLRTASLDRRAAWAPEEPLLQSSTSLVAKGLARTARLPAGHDRQRIRTSPKFEKCSDFLHTVERWWTDAFQLSQRPRVVRSARLFDQMRITHLLALRHIADLACSDIWGRTNQAASESYGFQESIPRKNQAKQSCLCVDDFARTPKPRFRRRPFARRSCSR